MTRSRIAWLSCFAVCAALGCQRGRAPSIAKLVVDVSGATTAGLTDGKVRALVEAEMARGPLFQVATDAPRSAPVLRMQVGFQDGPPETGLVRVRGAISQGDLQTVEDEDVSVPGKMASLDERAAATEPALSRGSRAVLTRLRAVFDARAKSRDDLVAASKSSDVLGSVAALVVLTEQGDARAVEGWKNELKQDDVRRVHRAIGALVELKARDATAALIETAGPRDEVLHREILFALAQLGGDEAAAYLTMVAENHDHPILRNSAKLALEELQASRQALDAGRQ